MLPFPIVQNMTDVTEQQQLLADRGFNIAADEIIRQSLQQVAQYIVNEHTVGEYDRAVLTDDQLIVYDLHANIRGSVAPLNDTWITDFKEDADAVWHHLSTQLYHLFS
jgi:hypothetical protein